MYATAATRPLFNPSTGENSHQLLQDLLVPRKVASPTQAVASQDLLKGQKAVEILHNGCVYRLQNTKLGKLILTK